MKLANPKLKPPILDYIVDDPMTYRHFTRSKTTGQVTHDYQKEVRIAKLTLKVKNMFMYHWLEF